MGLFYFSKSWEIILWSSFFCQNRKLVLNNQANFSFLPFCSFASLRKIFEPFSQAQYNACWQIHSSSLGAVEQGLKQSQYKVQFAYEFCNELLSHGVFKNCVIATSWSVICFPCANDPFRLVSSLSFITVVKVAGQGYLFWQGYNKGLYLLSKSSQV